MSDPLTSERVCEQLIQRDALSLAGLELTKARQSWPRFNSAHEGYAVIAEELDELWAHVKTNQKRRDLRAMRTEHCKLRRWPSGSRSTFATTRLAANDRPADQGKARLMGR